MSEKTMAETNGDDWQCEAVIEDAPEDAEIVLCDGTVIDLGG